MHTRVRGESILCCRAASTTLRCFCTTNYVRPGGMSNSEETDDKPVGEKQTWRVAPKARKTGRLEGFRGGEAATKPLNLGDFAPVRVIKTTLNLEQIGTLLLDRPLVASG